ncbi:MAG: TonB-dependent hemoglobin/transferrin/lactoferrin family receptor [Solimonas sp.]
MERQAWCARLRAALLGGCAFAVLPAVVPAQEGPVAMVDAASAHYDIPSLPLIEALALFGRQSGAQVTAEAALTQARRSTAVLGDYAADAALRRLLLGTGLGYTHSGSATYMLVELPPASDATVVLPQVTVIGQAFDPVYDQPGSAVGLSREDIDRLQARNTSDLLTDLSGVYAAVNRTNPGVGVNIRGLQDFGRVNMMLDGARQNFRQVVGHADTTRAYVDADLLGGVDVLKGLSSTSGGAGILAGSINFRTLEIGDLLDEDEHFGGRVNLSTGTNGYDFAGSTAAGWRAGDSLELVAAVSRKSMSAYEPGTHGDPYVPASYASSATGDIVQYTSQNQLSGLFKAGLDLSPQQHLQLGYVGYSAKYKESTSRDALDNQTVTANYIWAPDSRWIDLQAHAYAVRTDSLRDRRGTSSANNLGTDLQRYRTVTLGATLENAARPQWFGQDLEWIYGGEVFRDRTTSAASTNDSQASSYLLDGDSAVLTTLSNPAGARVVASAFSQLGWMPRDWLQITAGLRYDYYTIDGQGDVYLGEVAYGDDVTEGWAHVDLARHEGRVQPKLMLSVTPADGIMAYVSAGLGFRPPAITEAMMSGLHSGAVVIYLPDPDIEAERSRNYEIGVSFKRDGWLLRGDKARLKTALFRNEVKHYILIAEVMSPSQEVGTGILSHMGYVNLDGTAVLQGLELQLDYDVGPWFTQFSYTRTHSDLGPGSYDQWSLGASAEQLDYYGVKGDASGISFYSIAPEDKFSLNTGVYLFDRKLMLGGRWTYTSGTPDVFGNSTLQLRAGAWSGYHLADVWTSYTFNRHLTLRASVQNVRDQLYYDALSGADFYRGPGRTYLFTVNWKF